MPLIQKRAGEICGKTYPNTRDSSGSHSPTPKFSVAAIPDNGIPSKPPALWISVLSNQQPSSCAPLFIAVH